MVHFIRTRSSPHLSSITLGWSLCRASVVVLCVLCVRARVVDTFKGMADLNSSPSSWAHNILCHSSGSGGRNRTSRETDRQTDPPQDMCVDRTRIARLGTDCARDIFIETLWPGLAAAGWMDVSRMNKGSFGLVIILYDR